MLSMSIKILVAQLVNQELHKNKDEGLAMHFSFDIGISDYDEGFQTSRRCGLHLVYWCLPGSSYITVFSGITESPFRQAKDVHEWEHEMTHDSEWRQIGAINKMYFGMCRSINESRVAAGLETKAPILMAEHNNFSKLDVVYQWLKVEVNMDPKDEAGYRKALVLK